MTSSPGYVQTLGVWDVPQALRWELRVYITCAVHDTHTAYTLMLVLLLLLLLLPARCSHS